MHMVISWRPEKDGTLAVLVLVQQWHHAGKEGNAIFLITILIEENLPPCTGCYLH
jgi:hypothetical protein